MGEAAAQESREGGGGVCREFVRKALVEVSAVRVQGVSEEQFGLQGRLIAAGFGQGVGRVTEGVAEGVTHAAILRRAVRGG